MEPLMITETLLNLQHSTRCILKAEIINFYLKFIFKQIYLWNP
jgi:hypothetical protein